MAPRLRSAAAAALAFGALWACATPEPSRELYAWTDAEGNVRYTPFPDRIPADRERTREVVSRDTRPRDRPVPPPRAVDPTPQAPGTAAASTATPAAAPAPPPADPLDARIAELEAQVAADEEVLKAMISDPSRAGALRSAPEMKEIGERLPRLQAELATLRAERAARNPVDTGAAPDAGDGG